MEKLVRTILEAFASVPDPRSSRGQRKEAIAIDGKKLRGIHGIEWPPGPATREASGQSGTAESWP